MSLYKIHMKEQILRCVIPVVLVQ